MPTITCNTISHFWSFVWGIHQWPVDSPHKGPVFFSGHDYIMRLDRLPVLPEGPVAPVAPVKAWAVNEWKYISKENHKPLQWRNNDRDGVLNHQRLDCLFNRLLRRISKKASKLCVTGLCEGNPPVTGGFPSQRPVTRKMFPFDDVIMPSKAVTLHRHFTWTNRCKII